MSFPTHPIPDGIEAFIRIAAPQRRAAMHLGYTWYIGKRFCKSTCIFISSLSSRIESMGVARGMGSPRHAPNRRRRTREGPEPACVWAPFGFGVAHAGGEDPEKLPKEREMQQKYAASESHEVRETPIELDPNPKRGSLMKAASLAARSSRQQQVERSATDVEAEPPLEVSMEIDDGKEVRCPVSWARTTDAGLPRKHFWQTLKRAVLLWQSPPRKEFTDIARNQWGSRLSNKSSWTASCQVMCVNRQTKPSLFVATLREGEERCIYSAASKQLVCIIEDQVWEQGVVVLVCNKDSVIWKDASIKALRRRAQLVTNDRCAAEQIKDDEVENIAAGCVKIEVSGKLAQVKNPKSVVMDGVFF